MPKPATALPSVSIVFAESAPDGSPAAAALALASPAPAPPQRRDAASSLRKVSLNSLRKASRDAADAVVGADATATLMPNSSPVSRAASQRSAWFGSVGRKAHPPPAASAPDAPPSPAPEPQLPASSVPFPTAPAAAAPDPKPKGSWFSSSSPIAAPAAAAAAPTPAAAAAPPPTSAPAPAQAQPPPDPMLSVPAPPARTAGGWFTRGHAPHSSIDDSVPTLAPFPASPAPPEPAAVLPRTRVDSSLSTLNPSTSRFTLAMPLLGRPKVPLDEAMRRDADAAQPDPDPASASSPPSDSGSWWGYIGLGSPSSLAPLRSPPPPESPVPSAESPTSPDPAVEASPEALQEATPEALHEAPPAWYTPWLWYPSANPNGDAAPPPAKTEAELVKEAALARPDVPPPPPQQPQEPPPSTSPPPNPVLATTESRASWMSFFASAGARGKAIKEAGEMEVMHIDEDPPPRPSSPAPPLTKTPAPPPAKTPAPPPTKTPAPPPTKTPTPPLTKTPVPTPPATKTPPSRPASPASAAKKAPVPTAAPAPAPRAPNLVLPAFEDTFRTPPRSEYVSPLRRTLRRMLWSDSGVGEALPRLWDVLGAQDGLRRVRRVVVVGIHGWFPGSLLRQVLGEPTGTSTKFASMMAAAVEAHFDVGVLETVTQIVLEGEGTIERRVNNLYQEYLKNAEWVESLQKADAILVATHSQGSIVSTQLIDRLIQERHIQPHKTRVCCLAMCGIHLGPLRYLNTSSLVQPYLQYFESAAARELFEFQDSESPVAKTYVQALGRVLEHGTKFVYVASMNDQVVPIYSGSFTTAVHPLLLRALYIDGEAHSSSDFLSNLLVLLLRIRNAGLDDGGLLTHLSEATAGSLSGVGHSSAYEEAAPYELAVRFLFETSGALGEGARAALDVQTFTARAARNDYEIPWALRDVIANPDVAALFADEFASLRAAFDDWHPRTTILRDLRRKLEPIRRLPTSRL